MNLEGYEVWLIIILVLGVIASNIAVLKYSAKFKMPQFGEHKDKTLTSGNKINPEQQNISDTTTDEPLNEEAVTENEKENQDKT